MADETAPGEARRDAWTLAILSGQTESVSAAFRAAGAEPPVFLWNPAMSVLATEQNRFLLDYWQAQRGEARMPPVSAIDPAALRSALGYLILIEPVDEGRDFRYRLYGSLLATVSGIDLTGRLVSEHWASDYVVDFSLASYRAVYRRAEPLYTLRHPVIAEYTRSWERLVLPFAGADGAIARFVVGNLPVDRSGEVVRPRF